MQRDDIPVIDTTRVIIVGAGLAGLYAALALAPRPVLVISPDPLGQGASSALAQGGIAAAMAAADSAAAHAADTFRAGAGTVDAAVAASVTTEARAHIFDLTALGAPFDRDATGGYVLSREAAHSRPRVVRVGGDQAGAGIMAALIGRLSMTPSIQVAEGVVAFGLHLQDERVAGVVVQSARGSAALILRGPAVLLAGGGSAGLYALTTNPPRIRGQVIGMAARAGAMMSDCEFVQFHPTAIDIGEDPAPLATEALRGEGAILINSDGERFMAALHPDAELAPRDVVARAIFAQTQAGRRPMLDTRAVLGSDIATKFPAVTAACRRAGIDPVTRPIPVAAAAHYHMGGIEVCARGRTSLPGLWACGEASSTGLHGANRLASNGLLEALVYGRRAALDIAAQVPLTAASPVTLSFAPGGGAPDPVELARLRHIMTDHVGVLRNGPGLMTALRAIARIEAESPCLEMLNMTAAATLIAASALLREESRGAHYRTDFPEPNPDLAHRSRLTLAQARAVQASLMEPAS